MAQGFSFGVAGEGTRGVRFILKPGTAPVFAKIQERLQAGFESGQVGRGIADLIMRHGEGSVGEQFSRGQEDSLRGKRPWPRTKPFGRVPPPARTLVRTGALERAWLGGPGSITRIRKTAIAIGVDSGRFPQAGVFQSRSVTVVRAKRMGARGRSRMHWFLGLVKGAWISDRVLRGRGLHIPPRRVGINRRMLHRASVALREHFVRGRFSPSI